MGIPRTRILFDGIERINNILPLICTFGNIQVDFLLIREQGGHSKYIEFFQEI